MSYQTRCPQPACKRRLAFIIHCLTRRRHLSFARFRLLPIDHAHFSSSLDGLSCRFASIRVVCRCLFRETFLCLDPAKSSENSELKNVACLPASPNGISIGSAVFAGLTSHRDTSRHAYRPRIYHFNLQWWRCGLIIIVVVCYEYWEKIDRDESRRQSEGIYHTEASNEFFLRKQLQTVQSKSCYDGLRGMVSRYPCTCITRELVYGAAYGFTW